MATMINDGPEYMSFQSELIPQMIKQNNTLYTAFAGDYENKNVSVSFDVRVKNAVIKSNIVDIIKNDHVILQKNLKSGMFFLFEADKKAFVEEESGILRYEEDVKTKDYEYSISFTKKPVPVEVKKESAPIRSGDISDDVNNILAKYGISLGEDETSPVTDYMKSWKLGHPDAE